MMYQCPDCLGVHEEATEPVVGVFVRCEECLLAAYLEETALIDSESSELELVAARAA